MVDHSHVLGLNMNTFTHTFPAKMEKFVLEYQILHCG